MTHDENGNDAYEEDWRAICGQDDTASNGQRVTSALALRIAADILRRSLQDTSCDPPTAQWTDDDVRLALGAIAGIRAQDGVMGPDAEALGCEDGIFATRQLDIWIYG